MTVWVAMPAYNEAPRLPALLDRWVHVLNGLVDDFRFVVVNDGSTDTTASILSDFSASHPLHVITHATNVGLGLSLRDAFRFASDNGQRDDVLVTMDADNTQPPELFPTMLAHLEGDDVDVVIASRYADGGQTTGLSPVRTCLSSAASTLFRLAFPIDGVRDYTCGYRAYRLGIIQLAFDRYGHRFCDRTGFECTADVLLRLANLSARFKEVGMQLDYTVKSGASHMRVGRTMCTTLGLMIRRRLERAPAANAASDR